MNPFLFFQFSGAPPVWPYFLHVEGSHFAEELFPVYLNKCFLNRVAQSAVSCTRALYEKSEWNYLFLYIPNTCRVLSSMGAQWVKTLKLASVLCKAFPFFNCEFTALPIGPSFWNQATLLPQIRHNPRRQISFKTHHNSRRFWLQSLVKNSDDDDRNLWLFKP